MFAVKADGALVWLRPSKYHPDLQGKSAGAVAPTQNGKAYWAVQIDGRKVKRSHIVFAMTRGKWSEAQIDHINGCSLDDRPANLREATLTQNAWNHHKRAKASPLPMGVRVAKSGRFVARISVNKRHVTIGTFNSPLAASDAYLKARVEHFGEFA
jgi:hypothetical protein